VRNQESNGSDKTPMKRGKRDQGKLTGQKMVALKGKSYDRKKKNNEKIRKSAKKKGEHANVKSGGEPFLLSPKRTKKFDTTSPVGGELRCVRWKSSN